MQSFRKQRAVSSRTAYNRGDVIGHGIILKEEEYEYKETDCKKL